MQYDTAINYLFSFLNFERVPFQYKRQFNLKRMEYLLNWFEHPEYLFSSVLVAGTKGKGSTANFLSSILAANHYSVGLYTSPHLSDPRERIRINGRLISQSDFAKFMTKIRSVVEKRKRKTTSYDPITFFEIFTLLAILYFAARKIDLGIFEIGMGGRLDATNVLNPLVSVITPISFDHEEHLGGTLIAIAREKAAIIKKKGYVVSGIQPLEAKRVIQFQIRKQKAKGYFCGSLFRVGRERMSECGSLFDFKLGVGSWDNLQIKLPGRFQIQNAAVALMTAGVLENQYGFTLKEARVRQGLKTAFWPGRFEIVKYKGKTFILDGAHNGASINEVCYALKSLFPRRKYIVIFGTSREKNLERILKLLLPIVSCFVATKSDNPRAQEPKMILETIDKMGYKKMSFWSSNLKEALQMVNDLNLKGAVYLVTGSLFLIGEARQILKCRKLI